MTTIPYKRLIIGLTSCGFLLAGALGAPRLRVAAAPPKVSAPPVVIQGQVTAAHGTSISVRTPDQRPLCAQGQMCPMYIIAGGAFTVDIAHAVYESSLGRPISDKPTVGRQIIVVGAATGAHALRASVVERIVAPAATATPGSSTKSCTHDDSHGLPGRFL